MEIKFLKNINESFSTAIFCTEGNIPPNVQGAADTLVLKKRFSLVEKSIALAEIKTGEAILCNPGKIDDTYSLTQLISRVVHFAKEQKITHLAIELNTLITAIPFNRVISTAATAAIESCYQFTKYKEAQGVEIEEIVLVTDCTNCQTAFEEGVAVGKSVCAMRDVINTTSHQMTPQTFSQMVLEQMAGLPIKCEILTEEMLKELGAASLLSVSQGSDRPCAMAVLTYEGNSANPTDITAFIGKGITYDSGGLSLKGKSGMITMHHDMAGAAAVVGAMKVIGQMKPVANITAFIPLCENMLSAKGYRPGDIINSMNGKTILINSTDAEGRLILIDAMTLAIRKYKVSRMIDIATLTGGVVSALGSLVTGYLTNDPSLREYMAKASLETGDRSWEMPLVPEYLKYLLTPQASIANSSNGDGPSTINAGLFLQEFAEGTPWLHIDVAGTSWCGKACGTTDYGATGMGVNLLFEISKLV